jgi:hypothetical protein
VLGACLLATFSGCGQEPAEGGKDHPRASASGKVTFDGQPIPSGSVTFMHAESGTYANCPIEDGEYESESGDGPIIGKNTVTVVGVDGPNGTQLWGGAWSQQVDITGDTFEQSFDVKKSETKPYVAPKPVNDPGSAGDGEEKPIYEQ